jgi:hypothetical protein
LLTIKYSKKVCNDIVLVLLPSNFIIPAFNFIVCESCYMENAKFSKFARMKIEEAIVYCLASSGRGMRTEQIAEMINGRRLHLRKDGMPVS